MNLDEAINRRYSVRQYLDKPVDRSLIEEILTLSSRSPSWGNTQPVELAVAGGETARALASEFTASVKSGVPGTPDFDMPGKFGGVYGDRYKALGREVFKIKGIGREDIEARTNHMVDNFNAFGAPNFIYLLVDESLPTVYPIFDAGLMAAHICLTAASRGLGTTLLAALTMYPDAVRRHLGLAAEKKVVLGLAIGYEDPNAGINKLKTNRVPISENVRWAGI